MPVRIASGQACQPRGEPRLSCSTHALAGIELLIAPARRPIKKCLSSVVAGAVFDRLHSYQPVLIALGLGALVAVALAATLGKSTRDAEGLIVHGAH